MEDFDGRPDKQAVMQALANAVEDACSDDAHAESALAMMVVGANLPPGRDQPVLQVLSTSSARIFNLSVLRYMASYDVVNNVCCTLPPGRNVYFHCAAGDTVVQLSDTFRWGRVKTCVINALHVIHHIAIPESSVSVYCRRMTRQAWFTWPFLPALAEHVGRRTRRRSRGASCTEQQQIAQLRAHVLLLVPSARGRRGRAAVDVRGMQVSVLLWKGVPDCGLEGVALGRVQEQLGKGSHLSTFEVNLSRFCHLNHPIHPTFPTEIAQVKPKSGRVKAPAVRSPPSKGSRS